MNFNTILNYFKLRLQYGYRLTGNW